MDSSTSRREERRIRDRCFELGIPLLKLSPDLIDPQVAARVDLDLVRRLRAIPISEEDGQVTVAMADPTDDEAISHLVEALGCAVFPVFSSLADIETGLKRLQPR